MGDMADLFSDAWFMDDDQYEDYYCSYVTCKYCGEEGLLWDKIDDKWRLFKNGKLHTCY